MGRSLEMPTMPEDLKGSLTPAFVELFAMNVFDFADGFKGGGPDYYGVALENVAPDGSEVSLILTFRSGVRYCCFEFSCHFPHYAEYGWSRLRDCMNRHGLSHLPLPVIRKVRGLIERGAVINPSPKVPVGIMEGFQYEVGPFLPVIEKGRVGDLP